MDIMFASPAFAYIKFVGSAHLFTGSRTITCVLHIIKHQNAEVRTLSPCPLQNIKVPYQ